MKRKAVLIESSNVPGHKEILGARVDVQNWQNFLKSNLGGAWAGGEIATLHKPYSADVAKALDVSADCYCFVAFSGHGAEGSVVLNEYFPNFAIESLKPKCAQAVLIVDSCRAIERAAIESFEKRQAALVNESVNIRVRLNARNGVPTEFSAVGAVANLAETAEKHRWRFEMGLRGSRTGLVEMLACSTGQGAGEDPDSGGYYTSLLLQSSEQWRRFKTAETTHSTREAHDYAASLLPAQQRPEYRPENLAFPFAVKG